MPTPTAFEQELLELANRARANPAGEFDELVLDAANRVGITRDVSMALAFFKVDMGVLRSQLNSYAPVAPLAWNGALAVAAEAHSALVIQFDTQSHRLPGEAGLLERIRAAGYSNIAAVAENVFAYARDPVYAHAGFYIDWGNSPTGIQQPAGHRDAILNRNYQEVGMGVLSENDPATRVGPYIVTQNFGARRDYVQQLVGVVFDDADGDRFYDAGEGLGGIGVTVAGSQGSYSTTTWASGGYQLALPAGTYTVTFAGGSLPGVHSQQITIGTENVKLDVNSGDLRLNPFDLRGGDRGDWLTAREIGHLIDGMAGVDMASFVGASERVVIDMNSGTVTSGSQTWTLRNIENVTGTIFGDMITGDAGDNLLRGMGDYDWFVGSGGNDTYDGGTGRDTVAYSSASAGVTANLLTGRGTLGQANGDSYVSIESLTGSSHADRLNGDHANNVLRGLAGDDFIFGNGGNDTIDGGAGRDYLSGGDGNDRITGGAGNDTIDGGRGWDTALYSGRVAEYEVRANADGSTSVLHSQGSRADAIDLLLNIEVLQFSDGRLFL
ncbi:CAP domain-containing protein [Pseudotabrizicola algicola]|uniref:SCP domain-containing protein n=1 Tax=Pseudotabrizicola algicola TaxID=2709381 RepID=A0A6B3RKL1_9RHOB|nr:CAP domain-containing protein [Pseudotabrizicola algicola]NEX46607.1 hypothetical protein [Pseudotabrizicola algicola]